MHSPLRAIYFATQNQSKVNSLRREIKQRDKLDDWVVLKIPFDIPEPRGEDVREIAIAKVCHAQRIMMKTAIVALDAGFYIDCLNGWPGALVNTILKNEKFGIPTILKLMDGKRDRGCAFKECMAFFDSRLAKEPLVFLAEIRGTLASEAKGEYRAGTHWSELVTVFVPQGYKKTLAEMTPSEYTAWRGERDLSASAKFVDWLSQFDAARSA